MSTDVASSPKVDTVQLRAWLLYGAVAALAAGLLCCASLALEWDQGAGTKSTLGTGLLFLTLVPEVVVLVALLRLASHLSLDLQNPLRRSSICAFGILWLTAVVTALTVVFPDRDPQTVRLILGFASLWVAWLIIYALGWGGLATCVIVFLVTRFVGGRLVGHRMDDLMAAMIALAIVFIGSLLCYPVWFGASLLRFRDRLGPMATLLAVAVFLNVLAGVVLVVWAVVLIANTPGILLMNEAALNEALALHGLRAMLVGLAGEALAMVCAAVFFLSVRQRLTAGTG